MITYKTFINMIKERGYTIKSLSIDESNPNFEKFRVEKYTISKFLEFTCPDNTIISACGKSHPGGCDGLYHNIDIKCFNINGEESFQKDLYYPIPLTQNIQIVAEIIVTKILQKEFDKNGPEAKFLDANNAILKIIGSKNPCEYPIRSGVYKFISRDFLDRSFNLHPKEKMIFYAINPDLDIDKVKFNMTVDVFERINKDQS